MNALTAAQVDQVLGLAGRAAAHDGVEPLNEAAHFALRDDSAIHLFSGGDAPEGYLQWSPAYGTAQLVVDPSARRRGIGRALAGRLADIADGSWGLWAFGDLPPARGFAAALGLRPGRGLLVMERTLDGVSRPVVPDALRLRGYRPGDAEELLRVNAEAFAHHAEQGAMDAGELAARMAEPWFDPEGLLLGFDDAGLAGFHWTKRLGTTGEVYVVGVAPRAQGRGYGRVLLDAGLAHLASTGADHVVLYVDMAEPVAVRMYESAGFRVASRDVLYAPEHGHVQKQEQP